MYIPSFAQAFDNFRMDEFLREDDAETDYRLPDGFSIEFGNESRVCPSNSCKIIINEDSRTFVGASDTDMRISAQFRLQDDQSNSHFTPKKQALVERMSLSISCKWDDILENLEKNITRYVCDDPYGRFSRDFNGTSYEYLVNATFELPSKHLILRGVGPESAQGELEKIPKIDNLYFSMIPLDNWTYAQYSDSPAAEVLGFGPINTVQLTPTEFSTFILDTNRSLSEKMRNTGAYSTFEQESEYPLQNARLDMYVKYKIDKQDEMKVISQENLTIDEEKVVKIYADGIDSFIGIKFVEYLLIHNGEPYYISYMANAKDYEKYLPQFEHMVKTFKFAK